MERIWAGWRAPFVTGGVIDSDGCFLCDFAAAPVEHDQGNLVLTRRGSAFAVMNLYPYNSGHTMVAPTRHIADFDALAQAEMMDVMRLTQAVIAATRAALTPEAFNIGMNLGRAAGAGVPGHLHVHAVPRWSGDTNFMPVVGETKVLPESIEETYAKIRAGLL